MERDTYRETEHLEKSILEDREKKIQESTEEKTCPEDEQIEISKMELEMQKQGLEVAWRCTICIRRSNVKERMRLIMSKSS